MIVGLKAHPSRRVGFTLALVWALGASPLRAQSVTATADRTAVRLSEHLRVTFAVEGAAPLRVEMPADKDLLTGEAAAVWRVRADGPAATEPLPGGRERWTQAYRLDPYQPGDLKLTFAPARVTPGGALRPAEPPWPAIEVKVQTALAGARADAARPVTPIEELPPGPPEQPERVGWYIGGGTALLFAAAVVAALRRRWRERRAVPPGEWAAAELDRLGRDRPAGGRFAERLAAVLREYAERRFGIPAPRLTTAELLAEAGRAEWPAESVAALREVLERCDRAKFAGEAPTDAEGAELLSRAREWVKSQSPPVATGGLWPAPP